MRAEFIEWLVSDPQPARFIHPSGLALAGARITGSLDLSYATVDKPLTLIRCYLPEGINLLSAHLEDITVRRSRTGPVFGNMAIIHGDASFLMGDFGPVSFMRARIDGTLDFTGARILNAGEDAVNLVEANVAGDVLFHDGFTTDRIVYARLAKIGHDVSIHGAEFSGDGEFDAERATIDGTFYWVDVKHTPKTVLDLEDVHAGSIWDDEASWPAPGNLVINGFVYGSIAGGPSDGPSRLRWLTLQPPEYHSQPFRQLAKVLSEMGRDDGATQVRIAKEIAQRRFGHESLPQRAWSLMLQYHDRLRLPAAARAVVDRGLRRPRHDSIRMGLSNAHHHADRGSRLPRVRRKRRSAAALSGLQSARLLAGEFPAGRRAPSGQILAAQSAPPSVRQGEARRPADDPTSLPSRLLRWYLWLHILAGWTITPLLFAGLSGLVRPD